MYNFSVYLRTCNCLKVINKQHYYLIKVCIIRIIIILKEFFLREDNFLSIPLYVYFKYNNYVIHYNYEEINLKFLNVTSIIWNKENFFRQDQCK